MQRLHVGADHRARRRNSSSRPIFRVRLGAFPRPWPFSRSWPPVLCRVLRRQFLGRLGDCRGQLVLGPALPRATSFVASSCTSSPRFAHPSPPRSWSPPRQWALRFLQPLGHLRIGFTPVCACDRCLRACASWSWPLPVHRSAASPSAAARPRNALPARLKPFSLSLAAAADWPNWPQLAAPVGRLGQRGVARSGQARWLPAPPDRRSFSYQPRAAQGGAQRQCLQLPPPEECGRAQCPSRQPRRVTHPPALPPRPER